MVVEGRLWTLWLSLSAVKRSYFWSPLFSLCPVHTPPFFSSSSSSSQTFSGPQGSREYAVSSIQDVDIVTPRLQKLLKDLHQGSRASLAEAITLVESKHPLKHRQAQWLLTQVLSHRNRQLLLGELRPTIRVGLSGPPGAGKSTLVETLGLKLVNFGLKVAVLLVLGSYLQSLQYKGLSNDQNLIHLQYRINFFKKPSGISNMIYAVVITLSSNKYYHSSPDVYVPFLSLDENGSHTPLGSKVITLTFRPKEPVPSKFDLTAVFSTEDGVTYSTVLSPITLNFTDLFLPLPTSIQEKASAEILFSLLWDYIESIQQPIATTTSSDGHGILSMVHLEYKPKEWTTLSSEMLRTFEVAPLLVCDDKEDEKELEQEEETHKLMVFLPPCYHLLFKFLLKPTSANVAIATDNWRLLPLVNTYLQGLANAN